MVKPKKYIETLISCYEYGHDYQPVIGFDNVISNYQCSVCGHFDDNPENIPITKTNREDLSIGDIFNTPVLGRCRVLSIAKKYIRLRQLDFNGTVCKSYFKHYT